MNAPQDTPPPSKPDLSTPEGRAAWRLELGQVAFWPRMAGLGMIFGSGLVILWERYRAHWPSHAVLNVSYVVLAVGWVLFVVAFLVRNRYQRRRLSGL